MIEQQSEQDINQKIVESAHKAFKRFSEGRIGHERQWYRSILFLHGLQWIQWESTTNNYAPYKAMKDDNELVHPKLVTNRFAMIGQRLTSMMMQIEPNWLFTSASDSPEDMASLAQAEHLEEIISEESDIDRIRCSMIYWMIYTGNAFLYSDVEKNQAGLYDAYTEVYSPFQVYADMLIERVEDQPEIILASMQSDDEILMSYPELSKDELKTFTKIKGEESAHGLSYLESFGQLTSSYGNKLSSLGMTSGESTANSKRLMIKYMKRPCNDYPQGIRACIVGDRVLSSSPFPMSSSGDPILPLQHIKFDDVGGAFFARTPLFDLVELQITRNKLQSQAYLILLLCGFPVVVAPAGTKILGKKASPGAQLTVASVGENKAQPTIWQGQNVPSSLVEMIRDVDSEMDSVAGVPDILRGNSPFSGAAAELVRRLTELAQGRFSQVFSNITRGYLGWFKSQIELYKIYSGQPLGSFNIKIAPDSGSPRSTATDMGKLVDLLKVGGLFRLDNPADRKFVLQTLGYGQLAGQQAEELDQIIQEHGLLMQEKQMQEQAMQGQQQQQQQGGMPPQQGTET